MDMIKSTFINRLECFRRANSRNPNFINIDLYKLIFKEEALVAGYKCIKSNKGATTPGVGTASLDGFGAKRLARLSKALRNESWAPSPARRLMIPKPGKSEKRPLGIQGPEEKVVQSVMRLVLESIYEPVFSEHSFGFRPRRGAHDALKSIEQNYDGMVFAIEGDIKGMYDNVNHEILIKLLEKRIKDDRFIRLVRKMLRAGYFESGKSLIRSDIGTPQGSIVSPILANIYLHELDVFMSEVVKSVPVRNPKVRTPDSLVLENRMRKLKYCLRKGTLKPSERQNALKELRTLKVQSLGVKMYCDPSNRIFYTRYADDFIVGIAGAENFASDLRDSLGEFLSSLKLTLSLEKSKITNIRKDHAFFLGHRIRIDTSVKVAYGRPKGRPKHLKRVSGSLVSIEAPIDRIVLRLSAKDFCDHKGFPTPKKLWTSQEDIQIISNFNSTVRGIFGYYSGVKKRSYLQRIWYILSYSCAYTLAAKHRCSLSKIFKKHGRELRVNYGLQGELSVSLWRPVLRESSRRWQVGRKLDDPYRLISARMSRTKIFEDCCICGAPSSEMHHVRHVKGSRQGGILHIMGLLNRKQIPVCIECHQSIHSGRYDGIGLRDLVNPGVAFR